jgi:uncharacterized protein YjbI with pentapeptide repeats
MIEACRAAVRPRVVSPETGDLVLLEDEVAVWLEGPSRALRLVGGPGSGKTTALRHVLAVLGPRESLLLIDDAGFAPENVLLDLRRLIYTVPTGQPASEDSTLQLASWSEDDLVEYCLMRHREKCGSIMTRIRALPDARRLHGVPQLWAMIIDAFAADETVSDWRSVIRCEFSKQLTDPSAERARDYCLNVLVDIEVNAHDAMLALSSQGWTLGRLPMLRHRAVQRLLAAERVLSVLEGGRKPDFLGGNWPADLIEEVSSPLTDSTPAWRRLVRVIAENQERYQSVAATLLHAADQGWQPPPRTRANLTRAVLAGAVWPCIDLSKVRLASVDFSDADLNNARLDDAEAQKIVLSQASLRQASLRGANLRGALADDADLTEISAMSSIWQHASFRGAVLQGANFYRANMQHANFTDANLSAAAFVSAQLNDAKFDRANCTRADFRNAELKRVNLSSAILSEARFESANLEEANLERLHWPAAALQMAKLRRAYLTASIMPDAKLLGANLRAAGLADIDWEGADLRDADFSNCAFHLGSSRSGLVGSPIACEGSRTGFYTDDYVEQDFKSPEEIRKANLRGADLRGAIVDRADFYLVDLRGARYTATQADHFRRCGAILVDRAALR